MTEADDTRTARERAIARVRALLDEPLKEVEEAGYMIGLPVAEIVDAVVAELGDNALRLPRYYPADEGQPWLLGTARHVDPTSGKPLNMYARWKTGLPRGRVMVEVVEANSVADATGAGGLDLAQFVAAPDQLPHALRALIAACEYSATSSGRPA